MECQSLNIKICGGYPFCGFGWWHNVYDMKKGFCIINDFKTKTMSFYTSSTKATNWNLICKTIIDFAFQNLMNLKLANEFSIFIFG